MPKKERRSRSVTTVTRNPARVARIMYDLQEKLKTLEEKIALEKDPKKIRRLEKRVERIENAIAAAYRRLVPEISEEWLNKQIKGMEERAKKNGKKKRRRKKKSPN